VTALRQGLLPALILLAALRPLFPLDWPVQAAAITATFAEDAGDHFNDGIDLDGAAHDVHPVLPGELVFRYDENEDFSSLPRGVGSFVVLHHSQDVLSVYSSLAAGSIGPIRTSYVPADKLVAVGETGRSENPHLHFAVYDEETSAYLNPLSFLPSLKDAQTPVIRRVLLRVGDTLRPLENGAAVPKGSVEIIAEAYDLREDVKFHWPLALYSMSLSLDGKETARLVFDSLQVSGSLRMVQPSGLSLEKVYAPDGLLRCGTVQLRAGESRLKLAVRDFAGNEASREIAFTVSQ
jgi:hypothetical protein